MRYQDQVWWFEKPEAIYILWRYNRWQQSQGHSLIENWKNQIFVLKLLTYHFNIVITGRKWCRNIRSFMHRHHVTFKFDQDSSAKLKVMFLFTLRSARTTAMAVLLLHLAGICHALVNYLSPHLNRRSEAWISLPQHKLVYWLWCLEGWGGRSGTATPICRQCSENYMRYNSIGAY